MVRVPFDKSGTRFFKSAVPTSYPTEWGRQVTLAGQDAQFPVSYIYKLSLPSRALPYSGQTVQCPNITKL